MSNYTITTDFGAKDSLPSSNDSKVVRGSEFTTEFTNIQTAIATKADTAGDTFTGVVNFSADVAVNTNTLFVDVSEAKVGIGTSSPDQKLQVDGNIRLGDTATGVDDDEDYGLRTGGSLTLHANDSGNNTFNTALAFDVGNASGAQAASSKIQFKVNNTERMRIDSSGNVGIGTSSPQSDGNTVNLEVSSAYGARVLVNNTDTSGRKYGIYSDNSGRFGFADYTADEIRMVINSSGNVLVGKTSAGFSTSGIELAPAGNINATRTSNESINLNRLSTDGAIAKFYKDGTTVGTIGTETGRLTIGSGDTGLRLLGDTDEITPWNTSTNAGRDALIDLGNTNNRFKDLHLSGSGYFGGNVGIGTSSPAETLDVKSGNASTYLRLQTSTDGGVYVGNLSGQMLMLTGSTERMRIASSGNVGIGETNPQSKLVVQDTNGCVSKIVATDGGSAPSATAQLVMQGYEGRGAGIFIQDSKLSASSPNDRAWFMGTGYSTANFGIGYAADGVNSHYLAQNMLTIDTSGHLLVGTTESDVGYTDSGAGFSAHPDGYVQAARSSASALSVLYLNKLDNDGSILEFSKDGTNVGNIGSRGGTALFIESGGSTGTAGLDIDVAIAPRKDGALSDGQIDFGTSAYRFQDIYRSGSTYSTSDRNKKQDIRDLTDAEARVATVAKGSLKAFRYIDSVEAEGDEANIHFGIIAQDLKAAFEAEGLNANDYQVFKTTTYTDDDGVEQTTYSICYENLLAFIITAI